MSTVCGAVRTDGWPDEGDANSPPDISPCSRASRPGPHAGVHRHPAPEVGKGEGRLPVAAIGRPQEREQGLVLVDRKQLPVARGPPLRCEIAGEHPNLGEKWIRHDVPPCVGKCSVRSLDRQSRGPPAPRTGDFRGRVRRATDVAEPPLTLLTATVCRAGSCPPTPATSPSTSGSVPRRRRGQHTGRVGDATPHAPPLTISPTAWPISGAGTTAVAGPARSPR